MKLIEEVEVSLERLDLAARQILARPKTPPPRQSGLHLSGLLRYVIHESHMPGWARYEAELDTRKLPLLWFLGIAWEEACVSLYPETVWQPGEICWEGCWMNCDGHALLDEGLAIEEFKYTSAKRKCWSEFLQDWLKMQQAIGYCGGYGPRLVRWHVLYNREPWNPVYVRYLVEVEEVDVESTRRMIKVNRDGAVARGYEE